MDVSHYQGHVTWSRVHAERFRFAVCKATEGLTFTDSTFAGNVRRSC
ncbi:MAG: GH25 family lysozyme [Actinomycetes bacterium]